MSLALALFAMILLFSMRDQQRAARLQVDRAAGEHMKTLQLGLQRYLDQNRAALLGGNPIVGVANPVAPTLAELRVVNALTPSVGDTGANGLTYQLRVDRLPPACVPATDCVDLQGVLWATTPLLDAGIPQMPRLAVMQAAGGNDIGISNVNNALQILGQDGLWATIPNPLGNQPGVVVARAGFGSSTDLGAFLRRDGSDAGMVGNLNLNNNRIDNPAELAAPGGGNVRFTVGGVESGRVQANGLAVNASLQFQNAVAAGGACVDAGAVGRVTTGDGDGVALCQAGVWRTIALQANTGAPCVTNGATATAQNGQQIVCVGGTYVIGWERMPRVVDVAQLLVGHGAVVPMPLCGLAGVPNILLVPQDPGTDPSWAGFGLFGEANRMRMTAVPSGTNWTIALELVDENNNAFTTRRSLVPYNLQAIARTQCIY
jgi:hypothetical protein